MPSATVTRRGGVPRSTFARGRHGSPAAAVRAQRLSPTQRRSASRQEIRQLNSRQQNATSRAARRLERQRANGNPSFAQQPRNNRRSNRNAAVQPNAPATGTNVRANNTRATSRTAVVRGGTLRNQAFANRNARDPAARALARATFRGRFAEQGASFGDRRDSRRGRRHFAAIGWVGPLFWPYAYDDFVDYTFYPYAYDTFWPYAYDEVYEGVFGSYALGGTAYANVPSGRRGRTATRTTRQFTSGEAEVCSGQGPGLTDWPIDRITETVQPNEAQRAALAGLKDATGQAIEFLRSACPTELPSTPTGRLAAMRQRIEAMLKAVQIVRPALEKFYGSLDEEQKARFDALDSEQKPAQQARSGAPALTQVCSGRTTAANDLPTTRLEKALRPTEAQRAALDDLTKASAKAAEILQGNCPEDRALTPPGRIEAMEQRLQAMLQALDTVQPALEKFYDSLNDEQRARFNQLGTRQG
jgi:hypothetical protein